MCRIVIPLSVSTVFIQIISMGVYQAKANAEVREKLRAEGDTSDGVDDYENWRGRQKDADEYYFCKANDCLSDWRS
jgi:hypothetical protein